jgi:NRAMP (natural resistance-associated macrophage protein)-like metal ion transporter
VPRRPNAAARSAWLKRLGPGLITGASDDDPSGIATYSIAGAQLGYSVGWTLLFTYPLMGAIQEISARIGRTSGQGIASNIRQHYPTWLLYSIVSLLFCANSLNIGADLGAMGDATAQLIGGPRLVHVTVFGLVCALAQILMRYQRYVAILKWLTLSLLSYFITLMIAQVPWAQALHGLLIPSFRSDSRFWSTAVAILGTTISPYLFFWQASQEAEDTRVVPERQPLAVKPSQGSSAIARIRTDTYIGMAFSNLVALAILITAATALSHGGQIESATQAAEALKPVAGRFAFALFAFGIVSTGLLAVPVLAGSAAYALGETRRWPTGLARRPHQAKAFYATIAGATLVGVIINFSPLNPIKALYWCAVINGVVAVPVMVIMMLMSSNKKVMGKFNVSGGLRVMGWIATAVMAAGAIGLAASYAN